MAKKKATKTKVKANDSPQQPQCPKGQVWSPALGKCVDDLG